MRHSYVSQAEELIEQTGDRTTSPRVRILAFLLSQQDAVTHHQIDAAFEKKEKIDRVTLYRVLDWLVEKGLVHKVIGDRVWRFRANSDDISLHQHAHFRCNRCAKVICLDKVKFRQEIPLPRGYRSQQIELTVSGLCAGCT